MNKSLKTIQTLSRLGKILSKIVFIFSIIGAVGCVIGAVAFAFGGTEILQAGEVTINGIISNDENLKADVLYSSLAVTFIMCFGEIIIAKVAENYFKNELKDGTPFTERGADEMRRLGIVTICVSLGTAILSGIVLGVIKAYFPEAGELPVEGFVSVGAGLAFLALSVVFRYGSTLIVPEPVPTPAPPESPQQTEENS